jgi:hypothetical protein
VGSYMSLLACSEERKVGRGGTAPRKSNKSRPRDNPDDCASNTGPGTDKLTEGGERELRSGGAILA